MADDAGDVKRNGDDESDASASSSRIGAWLDERIGHRARLAAWLERPVAGGASWSKITGALVAICFAILAATGALLMTSYSPSPQTAWASVDYITHGLAGGWLVRGIHHFASHAMVVLVGVHLAEMVLLRAYEKPRELYFWLGLALFGLVTGFAITGHLLPWDQKGFWARKVEFNILGTAPVIGAWLQQMLQGGPDLASLGLTRAYASHAFVLPVLFVAILLTRAALARRYAIAEVETSGASVRANLKSGSTYAAQLPRDIIAGLLLLGVVVLLAWRAHGAPLDAPADPASDYPARPEWFLLPMFQLRKFFHGSGEFWGTVGLPGAVGLYLFALPLFDKRPKASLRSRAVLLLVPALFALGLGGLGAKAARHDEGDAEYQKARAKADVRASIAREAATRGVPPTGAVDLPELRAHRIFEKSCASCHVLGELGDPKKANAPVLDGWGTEAWIMAMLHDPDAPERFGRTPYKEIMPSADAPKPPTKPIAKDKADMEAVALFLATQGDEPSDPVRVRTDDGAKLARLKRGETIVTSQCTTCHLYKDDGDLEGSGTAPNLFRYGSIAWTRAQIANPTTKDTYREAAVDDPASKGHMPRFDSELSASDIDLVARWIRDRGRATTGGAINSAR